MHWRLNNSTQFLYLHVLRALAWLQQSKGFRFAWWRPSLRKDDLQWQLPYQPLCREQGCEERSAARPPISPSYWHRPCSELTADTSSKPAHQFIQVSWTVSSKPCFSMEQNGAVNLSFSCPSYLWFLQWAVECALTIQSWTEKILGCGFVFMLQQIP